MPLCNGRIAKANLPEELVRPLLLSVKCPAAQARYQRDVLLHRPMRHQPEILDHVSDAAPELYRIHLRDIAPLNADAARHRIQHSIDQPQRSRFTGPALAQQNQRLAPLNVETQAVQNAAAAGNIRDFLD